MFSLNEQNAKIQNVNARAELHGDEHVTACDIKIDVKLGNDALAEFHPSLKAFLYLKDADAKQGELIDDANHMTKLRMPLLGALKYGWEGAGYQLTVHQGLGGPADIILGDCEVDHIVINPQEGGTVAITARIIAHPNAGDIGKLCTLIQQEVPITLEPPSPAEAADLMIDKAKKKIKEEEGV